MEKYLNTSFTTSLLVLLMAATIIMIYAFLTIKKTKDKPTFFLKMCILFWLAICVSFGFDYSKLFKYDSVDSAYHFSYPKGKIIYKKTYKNLVFAYGTEFYESEKSFSSPTIFALYIKKDNKWKIQHIGDIENSLCINDKKNKKVYTIYKLPTEDKKTTGIFITNDFSALSLSSETEITDSYNVKYEHIEGLENYFKTKDRHVYFGVVTKKIPDNFYIEINGVKYDLRKYGMFCNF